MNPQAHFKTTMKEKAEGRVPLLSRLERGRAKGTEIINVHAIVLKRNIRQAEPQPLMGREVKENRGLCTSWL